MSANFDVLTQVQADYQSDQFRQNTQERGIIARGIATLAGGTCSIYNPTVQDRSFFDLRYSPGKISGVPGYLVAEDLVVGEGFRIRSSSINDNSDVVWTHYYRDIDGG